MAIFITVVSSTNQGAFFFSGNLVIEHLPAHTIRWGEGGKIANVWTLFHTHCQAMEEKTSVVSNTFEENGQISDLEKYLVKIMTAVQKTDQKEKKMEAERALGRQWHDFR